MLYRLYEHYYDEDDDDVYVKTDEKTAQLDLMDRCKEEELVCFICFQNEVDSGIKPIFLRNQKLYIKNCPCDGIIHKDCLKQWYETSYKCPICRLKINKPFQLVSSLSEFTNRTNRPNASPFLPRNPFGPLITFLKLTFFVYLYIITLNIYLYALHLDSQTQFLHDYGGIYEHNYVNYSQNDNNNE